MPSFLQNRGRNPGSRQKGLGHDGGNADALHGDLSQAQRIMYEPFPKTAPDAGGHRDVAARGP
ncbi:MAG: hypothetical protein IPP37_14235 [Saprospiraceae bacterium]|nr:hypothetical protein [Saprospiraceae bacterium]